MLGEEEGSWIQAGQDVSVPDAAQLQDQHGAIIPKTGKELAAQKISRIAIGSAGLHPFEGQKHGFGVAKRNPAGYVFHLGRVGRSNP